MSTSISARIRRALLGLTLSLSILFSLLAILLLYVTEDQVFVNQLLAEQAILEKTEPADRTEWRPANRHMRIWWERNRLPRPQSAVVGEAFGVYEYFDGPNAFFILRAKLPDSQREYFLTYDVASLLVVRQSRPTLFVTFAIGILLFTIAAMFVAAYLAKLTLRPLRVLTDDLESRTASDLPENFASRFGRDEIGLLAEALENALAKVQESAMREYEFNQGVSHELRSPIQVAKNASELLQIAGLDSSNHSQPEPLLRLTRAIKQMENVTEAFLWLAGNRALDDSSTNAKIGMEKIIEDHEHLLQKREIRIDVQTDDVDYRIPQPVFSVVVGNLFRNAVQHTDGAGIRCVLTSREIVIEDEGSETDPTAMGNSSGFGVGLEIVERICHRLGWTLTLTRTRTAGMRAVICLEKTAS